MWLTTISFFILALLPFGNSLDSNSLTKILADFETRRLNQENDIFRKGCGGQPADIVFILDDSRSIPKDDFDKQIDFVSDFVKIFEISPDKVRVGVVTFGEQIIYRSTFPFTQYTEEESLVKGISSIKFAPELGGSTQTGLAINYARTHIFNKARPGIEKIAIILTDGQSTYGQETNKEATLAKQEGILMIAIGVGYSISVSELHRIATKPEYVFTVSSFDALTHIKMTLGMKTCRAPTTLAPPTTPQMEEPCEKDIDVNFLFDSGMMGDQGTKDVIKFIKTSISSQKLDNSNIRFGVVAGACNKVYGFNLNSFKSKTEIMSHFDKFHRTELAPLMKETAQSAFSIEKGGRPGARKVALVFLKGKLTNPTLVIEEALAAKRQGVEIFVVNMDNMNSNAIINDIASVKARNHVLNGMGIDMVHLSSEFSNLLCTKRI